MVMSLLTSYFQPVKEVTGCNVGYAFVNFIHVQDLLTFAKKKLGEKW